MKVQPYIYYSTEIIQLTLLPQFLVCLKSGAGYAAHSSIFYNMLFVDLSREPLFVYLG